MKKVSKVMFDCNGFSAPAYGCDKPGDHSGYYVQATDYDELTLERDELAAQVERLRGAASGAKDMLIECANQFRAIGNQDGHGNFADKHAMYVDRVLSETPTQSLEASKRLWKETLAVHCYEYSFLADDRAVEQSILVSEVLSFEP